LRKRRAVASDDETIPCVQGRIVPQVDNVDLITLVRYPNKGVPGSGSTGSATPRTEPTRRFTLNRLMGVMGETDLTSTVALPTTNPTSPRATAGPPDDGTFEVGWMLYPENSATRIATTTAMTKTARELRRACLLGWGIADCRRGVGCAIGEEGPNCTIFNRARSDNNPYRSV